MMLYGKTPVMTKYLRCELCMPAFCAFLVFSSCFVGQAAGQDGPPLDWKSQYGVKVATSQEGDCSTKVKNGDIVYIRHRGIYADENEKMVQFDGDGGEPLRFVVGEKRIITGMEVGVIGQCAGETRWVEIPPRLAYDDPAKFGPRSWSRTRPKPVPDRTTVLYEITMHEVHRPGTLAYELGNFLAFLQGVGPWVLGAALLFGILYVMRSRSRRGGASKKAAGTASKAKDAKRK